VQFQLDRPFHAKVINELKSELSERLSDFERKEPDHASILKTLTALVSLLDKLDVFLAELVKYDYDAWSPNIDDLNRNGARINGPAKKSPEPGGGQEEEKRPERRF
jgi:hypothetical protein